MPNSVSMQTRLTRERRVKIINATQVVLRRRTTKARQFMVLLGLMAATSTAVRWGLLQKDLSRVMTITVQCRETLFRLNPLNLSTGRCLPLWSGSDLRGSNSQGLLRRTRELTHQCSGAGDSLLALNHFAGQVEGRHVLIRSDNTAKIAYVT